MYRHLESIEEFNQLVSTSEKLIVDFFATWCGPCKMLAPELEELASEHSDIDVVSVDVDKFEELAAKFYITAVPTMIFFKKGEQTNRITGYMSKDAVLSSFNK